VRERSFIVGRNLINFEHEAHSQKHRQNQGFDHRP
jgi:hypothetical protein